MKETKKISKKLSLAKETIRQLRTDELTQAAGGRNNETKICHSDTPCPL